MSPKQNLALSILRALAIGALGAALGALLLTATLLEVDFAHHEAHTQTELTQ